MSHSHSAPAARDRHEYFGLLRHELSLQGGSQHEIAVALTLRGEGREDSATHAEVGRPHVRPLLGAGEAQGEAAKIVGVHILVTPDRD